MKKDTTLATVGRHPEAHSGTVNPPVYRASTILFPTLEAYENSERYSVRYGRHGTPGTLALEEAVSALEGADCCRLTPSGHSATTAAILSFAEAGDEVLVADCVYEPTRSFCADYLKRFGIAARFFDPLAGARIGELFGERTRLVVLESPGTRSFEVQDIPAIAAAAHGHGALVLADNTWATGYFCRPLELGADITVASATKYILGHADALLGTICVKDAHAARLKRGYRMLGLSVSPDDAFLALRGMRTLGVRLRRHEESGLALARWLKARPEVARVLHPGLAEDPGHALWKRDFSGASGTFGVVLKGGTKAQVAAFCDGLAYFGLGFSFGGYESLVTPSHLEKVRTATAWRPEGPVLRFSAGLEDPEDLIADLEAGFARFHAAA